ncbi:hypothetical protein Hanom_Chr03g00208501 [Helianthus anomalus]
MQNSAVLVCFRHFLALKLSLGRQFYDPYFPTHYSSVSLGFKDHSVSYHHVCLSTDSRQYF